MNNQKEIQLMKLTDTSPMPFGKYKGTALANVPASYLIYIYEHAFCYGAVKDYIRENLDALQLEIKRNEKL